MIGDYCQAAGFLWETEKKLLTHEQWQNAIDAPTAVDAIKILGNDYSFDELESTEYYEQALQSKLKETYQHMYTISPHPEPVDILNLKYQYHNLKVLVKSSVSAHARLNSSSALSMVAAISPEDMVKQNAPEYLRKAFQSMIKAYESDADPQTIDLEADSFMFEQMLVLCEGLENPFITKYVKTSIDMFNLKLLLRAQRMRQDSVFIFRALLPNGFTDRGQLIQHCNKSLNEIAAIFTFKYFGDILKHSADSYDETTGFTIFEKLCDNLLLGLLQQSKYNSIGPEMIFAYILARENEIGRIRMLLACKINGIPDTMLRERLRDYYG